MSGCTPCMAARMTVPKMANSKMTEKHSRVPMKVTRAMRTGTPYQCGVRDGFAGGIGFQIHSTDFGPSGLAHLFSCTHGLRGGLHSCAASPLTSAAQGDFHSPALAAPLKGPPFQDTSRIKILWYQRFPT